MNELKQRIGEIDAMRDTCRQMLKLLKKLETLLGRPAEFNRRIAEVDGLRVQIHHQHRAYQLISAVSQLAELQRFSADRRLRLADAQGADLARGQLERDTRFVQAVIDGAETVKEILNEALERFERTSVEAVG